MAMVTTTMRPHIRMNSTNRIPDVVFILGIRFSSPPCCAFPSAISHLFCFRCYRIVHLVACVLAFTQFSVLGFEVLWGIRETFYSSHTPYIRHLHCALNCFLCWSHCSSSSLARTMSAYCMQKLLYYPCSLSILIDAVFLSITLHHVGLFELVEDLGFSEPLALTKDSSRNIHTP